MEKFGRVDNEFCKKNNKEEKKRKSDLNVKKKKKKKIVTKLKSDQSNYIHKVYKI